ncbi:MAG: Stp1/IreP family PP2C-type Ser/Thr phosphatase [Firmicutes bacterium]|nr:Stp1/IreP family PP2C-type Ser/Thr phosphatase [Bacillota bacterium]
MKAWGSTDVGKLREINEDDYFVAYNRHKDLMAVVCDGIGGSQAGEVASSTAIQTIYSLFLDAPEFESDSQVNLWLQATLNTANDVIFSKSANNIYEKGMGTTCVGVLITDGKSYIFNIGDSRIYAKYDDGFIQMTEDHSVINKLLKEGKITPKEAKTHVQKNTLTNALGVWRIFRIDINKIESTFDYLLICSDGLHGYVSKIDIESVVLSDTLTLKEKVSSLIALANKEGGKDNCTVILIDNSAEDSSEEEGE